MMQWTKLIIAQAAKTDISAQNEWTKRNKTKCYNFFCLREDRNKIIIKQKENNAASWAN